MVTCQYGDKSMYSQCMTCRKTAALGVMLQQSHGCTVICQGADTLFDMLESAVTVRNEMKYRAQLQLAQKRWSSASDWHGCI